MAPVDSKLSTNDVKRVNSLFNGSAIVRCIE